MPHTHKKPHSSDTIKTVEPSPEFEDKASPVDRQATLDSEWRNQAEFTVFFVYRPDQDGEKIWQTKVYHAQGKGASKTFEGFSPAEWADFILQEAGCPAKAVPAIKRIDPHPSSTAKHTKADSSIDIEFQNIDVKPWSEAPLWTLEIQACFKIWGKRLSAVVNGRDSYRVEFYMIDLRTHQATQVAFEQHEIKPGSCEYEVRQTFLMPHPGRYELRTFVLLPALGIMATRSGPVFNIVQENEVSSAVG